MNFVQTCYLLLFMLSIHSVWSDSYIEKIRNKRLAQQSAQTNADEATESTNHVDAKSTATSKISDDATSSPIRKSKNIDSVSLKSNAASDLQIPVQVIYDPQPETVTGYSRKTSKGGQRQRKVRRRKPSYQTRQFQGSESSGPSSTQSTTTVQTNGNSVTHEVKETTEAALLSGRTVEKSTTAPKTKQTRGQRPHIPIVDSESQVYSHKGEFHYSYESGDGTKAFERSEDKKVDIDGSSNGAVVGGFSYTDKEGNDFSLSYTADENGYRPSGAHLPTPPPIPPAIARALKYLATKPTPDPDSVTSKYLFDY